jgi:hypothetical protein
MKQARRHLPLLLLHLLLPLPQQQQPADPHPQQRLAPHP